MRNVQREYLGESVTAYLDDRRAGRVSEGTIRNELYTLRRLMKVSGPILTAGIDYRHAAAHWADAGKTKTSGLANDYTHLSLFFKWCRATRRIERDNDPLMNIPRPYPDERERRRIPRRDFPRLLGATEHPRDRIAIAIGLYILRRAVEISMLRIGDVDLQGSTILAPVAKGRRGQVKKKPKPISKELDEELRSHLTYYAEQQGELNPAWFLVPAKYGPRWHQDKGTGLLVRAQAHDDPLKPERAWLVNREEAAKRALKKIGFPLHDAVTGKSEYEGMHTLRRSGARALYDQMLDRGEERALTLTQRMLDHKSPQMTARYIGVAEDEGRLHDMIAGKIMYPVDDTNLIPFPSSAGVASAGGGAH